MTRNMRRTALLLVPILLILSAGPALAEGTPPPADPQLEAVRQVLAEMEAALQGALTYAEGKQADLAVAAVGSYLVLLRQLDGMIPAAEQPAGETPAPGQGEKRRPRQALRALTHALQQHGRLLGRTMAALPVEARNQVIELFRAEQAAGYQHPAIAQFVARTAGRTIRRIRQHDLEQALERARNRLTRATEAVTRLEAKVAELEARIPEITDPARKALAEKRLALARLDLEIATKTVARFQLLIEILEERLAERSD